MKKIIAIATLCASMSAIAGDVTLLGGIAQFQPPTDGVYWNKNQEHKMDMRLPAAGIRWDSKQTNGYSFGVQYTYFGKVKIDAYAVSVDAPEPGGYDAGTQSCVGPCAPLGVWHMTSEVDSIAFIGSKHVGNWSFEAGWNFFQVKTSGYVNYPSGGPVFNYKGITYVDSNPMAGVTYRDGMASVRLQIWRMEGKQNNGMDGYEPPGAFYEGYQTTLLAGYTF